MKVHSAGCAKLTASSRFHERLKAFPCMHRLLGSFSSLWQRLIPFSLQLLPFLLIRGYVYLFTLHRLSEATVRELILSQEPTQSSYPARLPAQGVFREGIGRGAIRLEPICQFERDCSSSFSDSSSVGLSQLWVPDPASLYRLLYLNVSCSPGHRLRILETL